MSHKKYKDVGEIPLFLLRRKKFEIKEPSLNDIFIDTVNRTKGGDNENE